VVESPAGRGLRLVPDLLDAPLPPPPSLPRQDPPAPAVTAEDGEIRLTYRELSALIEEAIRSV
jgi:hypothetical protein